MNSSIYRFTLGMNISQSQVSIPVMLGDTGREWRIILSDSGKPYIIADGCLAKLSIKRPTGTRLEAFCNIENNTTIVYKFIENPDTCIVEGVHDCDVTLYGLDRQVLATSRFTMVVSDRVSTRDDEVLTDDDRTVVDAMVTEEAVRQANEIARQLAEEERLSAEENRVSAEEEREYAETKRAEAEKQRIANDHKREEDLSVVTRTAEAANANVVNLIRTTIREIVPNEHGVFPIREAGTYNIHIEWTESSEEEDQDVYNMVEVFLVNENGQNIAPSIFAKNDINAKYYDGEFYVPVAIEEPGVVGIIVDAHAPRTKSVAITTTNSFSSSTNRQFSEIKEALGSYITDIDTILGGE